MGVQEPGMPPESAQISSMLSLGLRPHIMTGVLRHVVGEHFARRDTVEDPGLAGLMWRADVANGILIESVTRWKPAELGRRPAIIIQRGDWQAERVAVGNRIGSTPQADPAYGHLMRGSHVLNCLAGAGEEVEILAAEVVRLLAGFDSLYRCQLDLQRFGVVGMGAVFQLDEAPGSFGVPVTVEYASFQAWTVVQHAPKLRAIDFDISKVVRP